MKIAATAALALTIAAAATTGAYASIAHKSPFGTDILQQRKDVEEITIPQPRTGPSSPVPVCWPGSAFCF